MFNNFYFLVIFILSWGIPSFSITSSELEKLKLYRTYYTFSLESLMAHQFQAWVHFRDPQGRVEWTTFQVAIPKNGDGRSLQSKDYLSDYTLRMGEALPPDKLNIPSELTDLANGVTDSLIKNGYSGIGNSHGFNFEVFEAKVSYIGYFARVLLHETIPLSLSNGNQLASAFKGLRFYFVNLETGEILENKYARIVSAGILDSRSYGDSNIAIGPFWMDFSLPSKIEGTSVFGMNSILEDKVNNKRNFYLNLERSLLNKSIEYTRLLQDGKTVDTSLDLILSRQTQSLLPTQFQQNVKFQIEIVTNKIKPDPKTSFLTEDFILPVNDKKFHVHRINNEIGLEFKLDGQIGPSKRPEVTLNVRSIGQTVYHQIKLISKNQLNSELFLSDKNKFALNVFPFGNLELVVSSPSNEKTTINEEKNENKKRDPLNPYPPGSGPNLPKPPPSIELPATKEFTRILIRPSRGFTLALRTGKTNKGCGYLFK